MKETKYTYCRICEPNCGLKATVVDGKLTKVTGNKNHHVSQGYICARGLASLDVHHDPDRIKYPMKKEGDSFRVSDWKSSLKDIGEKLKQIRREYGNDSVGIYFGNPIAFDFSLSNYLPFAVNALKSRNIYSAGSQDCNNKFVAAEKVYGSQLIHPVPDIDNMDFLIVWGSNPAISKMSFFSIPHPEKRLKAIEKRGGRVIIIDPRKTETVRQLGEHIYIRPDTDVFLMMAMINIIVEEELYDSSIVNYHTRGFEELKKMVASFPPAKAAEITGIDEKIILSLSRDFANAKNAGIHSSLGINLGSFGTIGYWLVQCLNAITGRLDKKNSMIFCSNLVNFPKYFKLANKFRKPKPSRIGSFEPVMETLPGGILADEILTPGPGQIKALIVLCGNPLLTVPDTVKLEKAFNSLELLVSCDLFINETGGISDYVLPSKDFYEHWDFGITSTMFNPISCLNYTEKVVDAEGERKELWVILHEILMAAGYPFGGLRGISAFASVSDYMGKKLLKRETPLSFQPELLLRSLLMMSRVSHKKLKNSSHGLPGKEHPTGNLFKKIIMTDDKKINLAPDEFIKEKESLLSFFEQERELNGFKLIGQRQKRTHNTWLHNVPSFMEKSLTNKVSINTEDAARLGIEEGDTVEVKNKNGVIQIQANLTDTIMPGVISIPHGWGHNKKSGLNTAKKFPGVNVNLLTASGPENLEKMSGMAKLTGIRVDVEKVK